MLNAIKPAITPGAATPGAAIEMLMGCHERIRHFTGIAKRLAHATSVSPAEIVQAANSVHRYFTVALPLHEEDENDSIHPRLRSVVPAGELARPAADAMVEQHHSIDQIVDRFVPLLEVVAADPDKLGELAMELAQLAATLEQMFDAHLKLEEETIFPAMRKWLSADQLEEIAVEMRERRKGG